VIEDMARARETLVALNALMAERFHLTHTTIQLEDQALRDAEAQRPV
jgi:cobalt-zinc-cadmium efflux system protein